jgi:hypothetical protein
MATRQGRACGDARQEHVSPGAGLDRMRLCGSGRDRCVGLRYWARFRLRLRLSFRDREVWVSRLPTRGDLSLW